MNDAQQRLIMLSVTFSYCYAECGYAECCNAECRYAEHCSVIYQSAPYHYNDQHIVPLHFYS
jgi:hypothetical protein